MHGLHRGKRQTLIDLLKPSKCEKSNTTWCLCVAESDHWTFPPVVHLHHNLPVPVTNFHECLSEAPTIPARFLGSLGLRQPHNGKLKLLESEKSINKRKCLEINKWNSSSLFMFQQILFFWGGKYERMKQAFDKNKGTLKWRHVSASDKFNRIKIPRKSHQNCQIFKRLYYKILLPLLLSRPVFIFSWGLVFNSWFSLHFCLLLHVVVISHHWVLSLSCT